MANRDDWVSLSAALRAGTGAEERVAAGLLAAGQVWWWGSGQGGDAGRVGVLAGWDS